MAEKKRGFGDWRSKHSRSKSVNTRLVGKKRWRDFGQKPEVMLDHFQGTRKLFPVKVNYEELMDTLKNTTDRYFPSITVSTGEAKRKRGFVAVLDRELEKNRALVKRFLEGVIEGKESWHRLLRPRIKKVSDGKDEREDIEKIAARFHMHFRRHEAKK